LFVEVFSTALLQFVKRRQKINVPMNKTGISFCGIG